MTVESANIARSGRPKRRWRRVTLWAVGFAASALVAVALLGPWIAGAIARSSIRAAGNRAINGKVEVGEASLSWFGTQAMGPVTVFDARGDRVATFQVGVERGLLSLAAAAMGLSPMNLGKVSITGEGTVVRFADGRTSLDDLFVRSETKPSAGAGAGGSGTSTMKLPPGLAAELIVGISSLRLVDQSTGREVRLNDLNGGATFSNELLSLTMKGGAVSVVEGLSGGATTYAPAGHIRAEATIRDLVDATGRVTMDQAIAEVNIDLADVAMDIAGVLSGIGAPLVQGVGETARITAQAEGGLERGRANFTWTSRGVRAAVSVQSEKGVISLASPATLNASGAAVAAAASMMGPIEGSGFRLEGYPGVEVAIDSMSVPIASGRVDRRGVAIAARGTTTAAGLVWQSTASGGAARPVTLGPAEFSLSSESLAKGIAAKVNSGVTVDGTPAARVGGTLVASGLLDNSGVPRTGVPVMEGRIEVVDIATSVWQPLAQELGVDLVAGIGPRAEVVLTATPATDGVGTSVNIEVSSDGLRGLVRSEVRGNMLSISGESSQLSPRSLIGAKLESMGLDVSPGGVATVAARNVTVDLLRPLESAMGEIEVAVGEMSLLPRGVRADPLEVKRLVLTAQRTAGERPQLRMLGAGSHDGHEVAFQGIVDFPNFKEASELGEDWYIPEGGLTFSAMPTSLASLWLGEETGLDRLVSDSIGSNLTVKLVTAQAPDRSLRVSVAANSAQVESAIIASLNKQDLHVHTVRIDGTLTPEIAARMIDRFAPGSTSFPSLAGPAVASASVNPLFIPMRNGAPEWSKAGLAELEVNLQGDIRPPGVQPSVQATLRETVARVRFPLATLSGDSTPRPVTVTVRGTLAGQAKEKLAGVAATATVSMVGARPSGEVRGELTVDVADAGAVDSVLGKPGLLGGAAGETVTLRAEGSTRIGEDGSTWRHASGQMSIASPRLTTEQPLKVKGDEGRLTIQSPMVVRWTPDPAWLNTYALSAQRAGEPIEPDSLRVTEGPELTVRLLKLALPTGSVPRMAPGVFDLDLQIEAPTLALAAGGGEKSSAVLRSLVFRTIGGHEPGVLGFSIRTDDLGAGGGPGNAPALLLQGGVYRLADSEGNPTPDSAVVSMSGDVYNAPSRILDALANQDGLLAEALGPMVAVTVKTQGASQASGKLVVTMTSPRAELELAGEFTRGTFIAEGEPKIKLHTMTPDLGRMLLSGMPLIGAFEKRAEDGPAQVRVTGLRVPLDGHLEKLSGEFTVELGTARFETSGVFGTLLRVARQREAGMVGRRLQPLSLSIKDGVLTYSRWKVPLGEFTLDTRGTVDLVNRRMDIVTYLPFGALTDEAAGAFNTGLGRLITGAVPFIEQATMVPFRTRGGFVDARTEPDIELFLTETGRTLLRPDRIIRDGLQNIFKPPEKK